MKTSLKVDEKGYVYIPNKIVLLGLCIYVFFVTALWIRSESIRAEAKEKTKQMEKQKTEKF